MNRPRLLAAFFALAFGISWLIRAPLWLPALVSSLLLTAGWALWHAPLFLYRPGDVGMSAGGVAGWLFSLATEALLLTWLYNESRGSLLVVALFHAAIDVVFTLDISTPGVVNLAGMLITLWGVIVLLVASPRNLSKRGKQIIGPIQESRE